MTFSCRASQPLLLWPTKTPVSDPASVSLVIPASVKAAKATRVRYDNVRRKAIQMMGGWERGHGASGRGRGRGGPDDEE